MDTNGRGDNEGMGMFLVRGSTCTWGGGVRDEWKEAGLYFQKDGGAAAYLGRAHRCALCAWPVSSASLFGKGRVRRGWQG